MLAPSILIELVLFLVIALLVSSATAWLRVVCLKFGIIDKLTVNLPSLLAKLVDCNFCSAFWLSSFIGLILVFTFKAGGYSYPGLYLFLGVIVAPISRHMA